MIQVLRHSCGDPALLPRYKIRTLAKLNHFYPMSKAGIKCPYFGILNAMPPVSLGRASKACDLCRRHKTRCYAKDGAHDACLRCHTLSLSCSLDDLLDSDSSQSLSGGHQRRSGVRARRHSARRPSTDSRYARLQLLTPVWCVFFLTDSGGKDSKDWNEQWELWSIA